MQLTAYLSLAFGCLSLVLFGDQVAAERAVHDKKKHHHHKHHHKHAGAANHSATTQKEAAPGPAVNAAFKTVHEVAAQNSSNTTETAILTKMKELEASLAKKEKEVMPSAQGKLEVNGPLPADFSERFIQAAAAAAGVNTIELEVLGTEALGAHGDLAEIIFQGPKDVVLALENQAADPNSKLTNSPIRSFLMARDSDSGDSSSAAFIATGSKNPVAEESNEHGIDIDTAMPYGELEPFGREDTAQELTESSVKESDEMVDQLERAEVAEEKRSVFRALTRLRGAAITSFDGVARSQTGNIDEYNKVHQWRNTHPLHHLADEESDISKWAFPDNADF